LSLVVKPIRECPRIVREGLSMMFDHYLALAPTIAFRPEFMAAEDEGVERRHTLDVIDGLVSVVQQAWQQGALAGSESDGEDQ
jgi:hypothetical protein